MTARAPNGKPVWLTGCAVGFWGAGEIVTVWLSIRPWMMNAALFADCAAPAPEMVIVPPTWLLPKVVEARWKVAGDPATMRADVIEVVNRLSPSDIPVVGAVASVAPVMPYCLRNGC